MRDMGIRGSAKPYSDTMGKGEFRSILRDLFNEEFDIEWNNDNKEYNPTVSHEIYFDKTMKGYR